MCFMFAWHFYCFNQSRLYINNKMQVDDIECVFESMTATGSIFISNFSAAQNLKLLQSKGIKAILSVARSGLINHSKEDIPHYLYIPAQDSQDYPMDLHFNETYEFIEKSRKSCNVLVHCMVGVSRSVTIVIAYLLKKYKYSLGQVITMIQRKRRKLNPNKGFIEQLKKFSEKEGLICDFQESSVPKLREKSFSKQVRSFSAKKYDSPAKKNQTLNPIISQEKQNKKQLRSEVNLSYNQNSIDSLTKNHHKESSKQKVQQYLSKENKFEDELILKKLCHGRQIAVVDSKKSISTSEELEQRKRLSIEEKINKIRQKMIESPKISLNGSSYFNRRQSKDRSKNIFEGQNHIKYKIQLLNRDSAKNNPQLNHSRKPCTINNNLLDVQRCQESVVGENANEQRASGLFRNQLKSTYYGNPRANSKINIKIKEENIK